MLVFRAILHGRNEVLCSYVKLRSPVYANTDNVVEETGNLVFMGEFNIIFGQSEPKFPGYLKVYWLV